MARRLALLGLVALVAAGCGVRNSKAFEPKPSAACLRKHGFAHVTTDPRQIGFVAAFADRGGLKATSPTGNVLTIAFADDPSSTPNEEQAFRLHAPPRLRPHLSDIMSSSRNAVLVWTITPRSDEVDTVNRCLSS